MNGSVDWNFCVDINCLIEGIRLWFSIVEILNLSVFNNMKKWNDLLNMDGHLSDRLLPNDYLLNALNSMFLFDRY